MPIPKPKPSENEDEFITRCITQLIGEYGEDQAYAICITQWEKK